MQALDTACSSQNVDYTTSAPVSREWLAQLTLSFAQRLNKTAMVTAEHFGPLRVQRPFYPEKDGCCHVYLLHPPGGIVIGDKLQLKVETLPGSQLLLTTPSAGKVYGAKGANELQCQDVFIDIKASCVEWLPQETIIFDGANARLSTRIHLHDTAKFFGWDIIRLGRIASGDYFRSGRCHQRIEIWRDDTPIFIENTCFKAEDAMAKQRWGLHGHTTLATLLATVDVDRDTVDELIKKLEHHAGSAWGLTQKKDIFIARYLGDSVSDCRRGVELIWQHLRPLFNKKEAVVPRIWNT